MDLLFFHPQLPLRVAFGSPRVGFRPPHAFPRLGALVLGPLAGAGGGSAASGHPPLPSRAGAAWLRPSFDGQVR